MKKFVSVMLVLCMVLALVPAMAFAAAGVAQVDDLYFDTLKEAIAYAGVDGHSNRVDLKATSNEGLQIIIDKNINLQLNGYRVDAQFVVESKATLTISGDGTVGNGKTFDDPTIYNHGTVLVKGAQIRGTVVNFGTMTFDDIVTSKGSVCTPSVAGAIQNGDSDHTGATLTIKDGTYYLKASSGVLVSNWGTVTVEYADMDATGAVLFKNYGKVTLSDGRFVGKLHVADSGATKDVAPVVNGGVYTDVDAALHAAKPVAGMHFTGSDMYVWYMVSEDSATWFINYMCYTVGQDPIYVDFLYGDMYMTDMPKASDGVTYYNMWNSNYTAYGEKVYGTSNVPGLKGTKLDGRGLVNGLSDFTIVAKKVDGIFKPANEKEQVAADLLTYNQHCVQKVEANYDRTNANEVWVTVTATVDVDALNPFSNPYAKYGNLIGPHKWVPIAIGFKGLNNDGVKGDLLTGINSWNMITTGDLVTDYDADTTYMGLWVSGDHNDIGGNAGFEFVDTDTNILYHVDVVIKDADAGMNAPSEPDDKDNAETYPGDGKDKPAASGSTTAPSGTGAGDGPAKTGDNSTVMLWATLMVASAAGVAICIVDEAKKRSHK